MRGSLKTRVSRKVMISTYHGFYFLIIIKMVGGLLAFYSWWTRKKAGDSHTGDWEPDEVATHIYKYAIAGRMVGRRRFRGLWDLTATTIRMIKSPKKSKTLMRRRRKKRRKKEEKAATWRCCDDFAWIYDDPHELMMHVGETHG